MALLKVTAPGELKDLYQQYQQKSADLDPEWMAAFGEGLPRPTLYEEAEAEVDEELPRIADPAKFLSQLVDADQMSHDHLYLALENSQMALQAAQAEYLSIEMLLRHVQGSNANNISEPQKLEDFEEYDEKKKALLYGYKFNQKVFDLPERGVQDPFAQGGFVPTATAYKQMQKAVSSNPNNIYEMPPIERDGKIMISKLWDERNHRDPKDYGTNAFGGTSRKRTRDQAETPGRNGQSPSDGQQNGGRQDSVRRTTRFAGAKVPPTRETSSTPDPTPTPKRRRMQPQIPSTLSAALSPGPDDGTPDPSPVPKRQRTQAYMPSTLSTAETPSPAESPTPKQRGSTPSHSIPKQQPRRAATPKKENNTSKWTNESLLEAVRRDPTFLHPDPVRRAEWQEKILKAANPVRTHAMLDKWNSWHNTGEDKRPRKKSPKMI